MKNGVARSVRYGPWLVALGAALWGTESAWRIPLNNLFDAEVIVFGEHVLILLMFLPLLIPRLKEISKIDARTWGFLLFSGFAGSAVGTIFFTLALKYGNPTVVNVILNIQQFVATQCTQRDFERRSDFHIWTAGSTASGGSSLSFSNSTAASNRRVTARSPTIRPSRITTLRRA